MRSNSYTLGFAAMVCIVCSLFVSGAATLLKDKRLANERADIQKNILACMGVVETSMAASPEEISTLYARSIREAVIDAGGAIVAGRKPSELDPEVYLDPLHAPSLLPIYMRKDDTGRIVAYAIPIAGKGLWSTLYGYLAMEPDGKTVKGITFYKHGETPGLGAEIEEAWFQENFIGKETLDAGGKLASITVLKGKAADFVSAERLPHYVDGISGATMTSNGVTRLLRIGLERYEPFFAKVRSSS